MPTTMQESATIAEQLRALVRLQLIDTRIDQLEKLRGDLPDEIRDLRTKRPAWRRVWRSTSGSSRSTRWSAVGPGWTSRRRRR